MPKNGKEEFEEIPGNDPQLDPSEARESAPGLRPRFGWQEDDAVVFRDRDGNRISGEEWKAMLREDAADRGEEGPKTPSP